MSRLDLSVTGQLELVAVVRPAHGRSQTVLLSSRTSSVEVPEGFVSVEVRLPSGEVLTREEELAKGQVKTLEFHAGQSPHEWLRWSRVLSDRSRSGDVAAAYKLLAEDLHLLSVNSWLSAGRLSWMRRIEVIEQVVLGPSEVTRLPVDLEARADSEHGIESIDSDSEALSLLFSRGLSDSLQGLRVWLRPSSPDAPRGSLLTLLPIPWHPPDQGLRPVQFLLSAPATDGFAPIDTEVIIQDPQVAPILGYVQSGDIDSARALVPRLEERSLEMLRGKFRNPYAACAGAYVLRRLGRSRLEWTQNLWRYFEWLPDGGIVHAAHLLRQYSGSPDELRDIRDALVGGAAAGPPVFTDGIRLLVDGLAQVASTRTFREDAEVARALAYARMLAARARPQELCTTLLIEDSAPELLRGWRNAGLL